MQYTVQNVRQGKSWTGQHGTFDKYYLDLASETGVVEGASMNRKAGGNPPQIGETIAGNVTQGNYGPEFKMDYEEMKASQPQRFNGGQSNTGGSYTASGNTSGYSDDKERRITRLACQKSAAILLQGTKPDKKMLKATVDWFYADALGLEDAPAEPTAKTEEPPAVPEVPAEGPSDDDIPW